MEMKDCIVESEEISLSADFEQAVSAQVPESTLRKIFNDIVS